jgi:hypothetical protein
MTPTGEISRAMKALIDTHGKDAAQVAEKRAETADLGGSGTAAHTWRQIAGAIREGQRSRSL